MIPKVIHYCWFGKNPLPPDAKRCIESWKKYCPNYTIIQWDESNYDVNKNKYTSDAYKEKKWAFVSDYAGIDIVFEYGGIYFDTDVELVAPIDKFLNDGLFCGWENSDPLLDKIGQSYENSVAFGLGFGAEKGHPVLKKLIDVYDNISFYNSDGSLNLIACPRYQTEVLVSFGLNAKERSYQEFYANGYKTVVYPEEIFSPKSILTGKIHRQENTVAIHHFSMSWVDPETKKIKDLEWELCNRMSYLHAKNIVKVVSIPLRVKRKLRQIFRKNIV